MLQAVFKVGRIVGKAVELNHNMVIAFKADNRIRCFIALNVRAQSVHLRSFEIERSLCPGGYA